jgi:hypothetical protein
MKANGKTYHAKFAKHGDYVGVYIGNDKNGPLYRFPGGVCHSFDADHLFENVLNNTWVEEFYQ